MPRFFFHIEDGAGVRDDEGVELESLAAARCAAVRLAGQMICDCAGSFWDKEEWKLTATGRGRADASASTSSRSRRPPSASIRA